MNNDIAELETFGKRWAGQFRATHILVRENGAWQLVGMHLGPIAAPPTAPQQGR
jgi:hypothetical protein